MNPISAPARTARRARARSLGPRMLAWAGAIVALAWPGVGAARAATDTATFTSPGPHSFVVPSGVRSLTVIAIGATGGSCPNPSYGGGGAGGAGAALTATVPVLPGETLSAGVGAPGARCGQPSGGAVASGGGGAGGNGGPNGGFGGGGGGGASLVGVSSPSPALGPQLLVVAGAGGGGEEEFADGGPAGSGGKDNFGGVGGGGPGTSTAGGAGGIGGVRADGVNGLSGSFGLGGTGGDCSRGGTPDGGGGGGGGGYFGGGGGGCATGGGGGGSSFVVPGGAIVLGPTPTSSPAVVSITYAAPTADESPRAISFGGQAPGTAGPEQILTVSNKGSATLIVAGVQLGGSNPDDFLLDDRCQQPVAVGSSCQVGVRFDPQSAGARSATLKLVTNASRAPTVVALSGGAAGPLVGARRHAVEVVSCRPSTGNLHDKRRAAPIPAETCTAELIHGVLELTATGNWTHATIARRRVVYAKGAAMPTAHGGYQLLLTDRRALKAGSYTLILRNRPGRRWITRRLRIVLR